MSDQAYYGVLEEYHQKIGNYYMYDYYKKLRLEMENKLK